MTDHSETDRITAGGDDTDVMLDSSHAAQAPARGNQSSSPFPAALRGYDRQAVDAALEDIYADYDEAVERYEVAEATLSRTREELDAVRGEARTAKSELERGRPSYDALGARVGEILRLAEEEGQSLIDAAQERVRQVDSEREQLLARARDEAQRVLSAAHSEAETTRQQTAEQVTALGRQRDAIRQQLTRLRDDLGAAMGQENHDG